nr:hypothetical protein [Tanacetum cinerariifolium]
MRVVAYLKKVEDEHARFMLTTTPGSNEDDNSRLRCGEYAIDLDNKGSGVLSYVGGTATGTIDPDWSWF